MLFVKKRMNEFFGNVEVVNKDKGYYILRSIKVWNEMDILL